MKPENISEQHQFGARGYSVWWWFAGLLFLCSWPGAIPPVRGACVPPVSGLTDWWPGDGNATDLAGTNSGILQGGAMANAVGMVAQAFSFDGTNSYVQIPDSPVLRPTNLTIEVWVRFSSLDSAGSGGSPAGQQYIVFKQNTRSSNFEGYYLAKERRSGGDIFVFGVSSSAGQALEVDGTAAIVANTWYHLAAVRGPNFIQLYVNGSFIGQTAVSFAQNYGNFPLYFGSSGQSYWDHKFKGLLDEVSLYNRALASNEIAAIYAAGAAGKCKPVAGLSITTQPQSQSIVAGSNALFTVAANGPGPIGYQWQFNGGALPGSTTPTLTLTNVQPANAGGYSALVTNPAASMTSSVAVLTVLLPPVISGQPQSLTNIAGTTAVFIATATGTAPLNYQWQQNGLPLANNSRISGALTSSLTISNVQAADAGNYTLVVSNAAGVATSAVAALTVNGPPVITSPPTNQFVAPGSNALFTVAASGTAPLTYEWLFNGTLIGGASGTSLTINGAQISNVGNYAAVVTNGVGAVTSSVAVLSLVTGAPCVLAATGLVGWWPGDGNANDIVAGENGTLQGTATASAPGFVAQSFTFDGTSGYVSVPDSALLRPTNLTIECWVKFSSLDSTGSGGSPAGQQYIVFKQNTRSSNFEGYYLGKERVSGGDIFAFVVSSATGQAVELDSAPGIAANTWYHVAGVRAAGSILLYINGQLVGQSAVSFPQNYGAFPLYFGTSGQSFWDHKLKGALDEVSIYNRALGASEIAAIYAAGSGGKCKGAIAPTILVQPANQILVVGGSASFTVSALGSAPLAYRWFKDGFGLADGARISGSATATLTLTSLQSGDAGNYQVSVANSSGSVTSSVASLSTGVAPTNDAFASAAPIAGGSGSILGNNANATKQSGEPNHAGNSGGVSVWYNWTAPSTSPVTFDTAMSAFDTLLAVYTGTAVNGLTLIASNNDIGASNPRSRLTFTPVAGTVYRVAVDGANGANGNFTLRWAQASTALPDLSIVGSAVNPRITVETFSPSSCAVVEGLIQAGTRRLIRFDTETENSGTADLFFGNPANNPLFVWAPCHAHYHFQNYMSYRLRDSSGKLAAVGLKVGFCILDVFRWSPSGAGNAKYTCTNQGIQVGWGDLYDSTLDGQWIDITGLPDGNYTIEIEANPLGIIQEANYANNITQVPLAIGNPSAPPLNDNFASAQALLGTFTSVSGTTLNATKEAGEPNHAGNTGGHSVWYQWTALSTKPVTIDTFSSSFNTLLAVYTGTSVGALSLVASNDDVVPGTNLQSRVVFNATAGTVYSIAVDGYNGATGSIVLTLNQTLQNDNFAACQFVGGVSGVAYGANAGATKEPGEPNHAGNAGGQSIWYCWTAPINGSVTFDTIGSTFNTLLAVYTGNTVSSLTLVASNDDILPGATLQSSVTFNATGLTMYHIAIDGFNGDSGDSTLNWNLQGSGAPLVMAPMLAQNSGPWLPFVNGGMLKGSVLPGGEFQVAIAGTPQQVYRVERSCDLAHWQPLASTVADFNGQAWFTDKASTHSKTASGDPLCGIGRVVGMYISPNEARFYRAVAVSQ